MPLVREPNAEPIPGYRLISPLGSGGFGEVWKCEAPGGLFKAIKFVFGNLNALDLEGVRAEQELNALQRVKEIRHPFILSLERVEVIGGELVIVMELADKSLNDRLLEYQAAGQPGIPREELLGFMRDAAEALDLMNVQYDLQHLDIKPRNLFVVSNHIKVADFGLVKDLESMSLTSPTSGLLGAVTPLYGAPETFQGIISRHSDQYSLAIVYQELLTGKRPFSGKNPRQLAVQHIKDPPDLAPLPLLDREAIGRALAKDPRQRFPSCMAFVRALVSGHAKEPSRLQGLEPPAVHTGVQPLSLPNTVEDLLLAPIDPAAIFFQADGRAEPEQLSAEEIAQLSVTVAQPLTGSLKPTLIVGLGGFGRLALQSLRCRIIDRFGNLAKLPLARFLCLDTDAGALRLAMQGAPEQALGQAEVLHLPLQPMGYYRRHRLGLEKLTEWLPLEKLYAIPRSLETQGTRALGRLALTDSYQRLVARIKRELQLVCDPEHMYQSVSRTGLPLRSETPQVYLLASASGGSGSGMLLDLAYACRRILQDLQHPDGEVVALLSCGAVTDPATPPQERSNLYATLTEINHFSDPSVPFVGQYGLDGPNVRDPGPPFSAVYLSKMVHRSPEGLQQTAARIASYVFHDLSTPLGLRLAQSRQAQLVNSTTPFRSFGTYAVWFPRGLMLRIAGRLVGRQLLYSWSGANERCDWNALYRECDRLLAEATWQPANLRQQIEHAATTGVEGSPGQALMGFLAGLQTQADQPVAREDPANWCRLALEKLREWVGSGVSAAEETSEWRKSRMHRLFAAAIQKVTDDHVDRLARPTHVLFDRADYRLAAADASFAYFSQRCDERMKEQEATIRELTKRTELCWQQVDLALQACLAGSYGGFSLFVGNRTRKLLHGFMDRITAYARQRLTEESARSVQHFYASLQARLHDLRRDLSFCQERLRHLAEGMLQPVEMSEEVSSSSFDLSANGDFEAGSSSRLLADAASALASRVVLPGGASDLDTAANDFVGSLTPDQWQEMDQFVQDQVLAPLGGLYQVCITSSDLARNLGAHLLDGAVEYLGHQLPVTDVSEAELSSAAALEIDLKAQAKAYFALATPSVHSEQGEREESFLLLPSSDAGKALGTIARQVLKGIHVVRVSNRSDLLYCREQVRIEIADLRRLLDPCKRAYMDTCSAPPSSPHARCDTLDWIPLDP